MKLYCIYIHIGAMVHQEKKQRSKEKILRINLGDQVLSHRTSVGQVRVQKKLQPKICLTIPSFINKRNSMPFSRGNLKKSNGMILRQGCLLTHRLNVRSRPQPPPQSKRSLSSRIGVLGSWLQQWDIYIQKANSGPVYIIYI